MRGPVNTATRITAGLALLALAGCGSATATTTAGPAGTTPAAGRTATVTVTVTPTATGAPKPTTPLPSPDPVPAATTAPAAPPSAALTNASAVVAQFYQDITDGDYAAAWQLGGDNLAAGTGQSYDAWVAGYADTTASISITSYGSFSSRSVWADISAVQLDGSVRAYYGTYTVSGGVITSADITQSGVKPGG
jgi:hypothetical protein